MTIHDTVDKCKTFFNINCTLVSIPFCQYKDLVPKAARGVYILQSEIDQIVYVGKGNIRDRQDSHWPKANGDIKSYTVDPKGWQWLRSNFDVHPELWTLHYVDLHKETELSAMEGSLIHFLQPITNDETFKDRAQIG
jgi:hypothetical protein